MRRVLGLLLLALPGLAADWVHLRTPDLELLTDSGERAGRDTLARLFRIRNLFPQLGGPSQPLRIFLFASEADFRPYAPGAAVEGFYQSGPEREYIALRSGASPGQVVVHEYIHLLLNHGTAPLPLWFEEGTAEFYSTIEFPRGRLLAGTPPSVHLATLSSASWLSALQLNAVTRTSRIYDERSRAGVFYAESWALVHMLNLAPAYREKMPAFVESLAAGAGAVTAFEQAFGHSMERALVDLRAYLPHARALTMDATVQAQPPAIEASRVSSLDASLALADLALRTNHPEIATRWYRQIARQNPGTAAAESALGFEAMLANDRPTALAHLQRALSLDPRDSGLWFEYAMLERESGSTRERVDELLGQAAALNPDFAEARFLLGVHATDDGRYEEAVSHLKEAARILPRQSSMWHALAFALAKMDQKPQAAEAASRALRTAATPEEERMAESLLESLR